MILNQAMFDALLFTGFSKADVLDGDINISDIGYLWLATNMLSSMDLHCKPHVLAVHSHHLSMKSAEVGIMPKAHHIGLRGALEGKQGCQLPT